MKFIYPAIITPQADGSYTANVVDLKGCTARGFNLDDCMEEANHAMLDWITLELEETNVLPPISDAEDLRPLLKEGELIRSVCVTYRAYEGWDE